MRFRDRFFCFISRLDALCDQSFYSKRRVFAVVLLIAAYFSLLGGLFSGESEVVPCASSYMFDAVYFVCSLIFIYLSGCTVFAGLVCFCAVAPFAFIGGYQHVVLFTAASSGTLSYFLSSFHYSLLLFVYCIAASISVSFSSFSVIGVREMLALGRFRDYSLKFALLIAVSVGAYYAMYIYLF